MITGDYSSSDRDSRDIYVGHEQAEGAREDDNDDAPRQEKAEIN
jgi:hypothetical protein